MIKHPNVISVDGLICAGFEGLVMEYAEYGTLRNVLTGKTSLDINKWRLKLMIDIANGMNYLHTHDPSIIHRDLKASNILVCSMGDTTTPIAKVKIIPSPPDFCFFNRLETLDCLLLLEMKNLIAVMPTALATCGYLHQK